MKCERKALGTSKSVVGCEESEEINTHKECSELPTDEMPKVFLVKPSFLAKKDLMKEAIKNVYKELNAFLGVDKPSGLIPITPMHLALNKLEAVFNECFSQKNSVELTPSDLSHLISAMQMHIKTWDTPENSALLKKLSEVSK